MFIKLKFKDILFVAIQMALLIALIFPIIDYIFAVNDVVKFCTNITKWIGFSMIIIAIVQLNKYITPFPTPKQGSQLIQTGLFKYVRHPIYTGIVIVAFSLATYNGSLWQIVVSLLLLILFYFKSSYEEKQLAKMFSDYSNYKCKAGRFLPKC
jgi:protein-S-isoprenylcysteine O-methyltransferase Ste14